jgi:hypothetical protein
MNAMAADVAAVAGCIVIGCGVGAAPWALLVLYAHLGGHL